MRCLIFLVILIFSCGINKSPDYKIIIDSSDEFLNKNPLGKIPVLECPDGHLVFETTAIVAHIVETKNITYQNYDSSEVGGKKVNALEERYTINAQPYLVLTDKQLIGYSLVICCATSAQ